MTNSQFCAGVTPLRDLHAEVRCRVSDKRDYLDDLKLVGTAKLIGYLPLSTILDICHADPHALRDEAINKGLTAHIYTERACSVGSGALYIFDAEKLRAFLSSPNNASVLSRHQWPTEPHAFVRKVVTETAEPRDLYDLIALTFNDRRPEYFDRWHSV
jgi:hypothetical protein